MSQDVKKLLVGETPGQPGLVSVLRDIAVFVYPNKVKILKALSKKYENCVRGMH